MDNCGIDKLAFYTPPYYLPLEKLANARDIPIEKIFKGLGQQKMSVIPPWEDIVTMAIAAAQQVVDETNRAEIDCILFATESGLDFSKASSLHVHEMLGLHSQCRCVEVKQACYAGTFALQTACSYVSTGIHKRVLVICSDVARYGFNTPGESSQGAGAVAMVVGQNPRLAIVNPHAAFLSQHVYDFWRPNGLDEALVDGKFSCQVYLEMLSQVIALYHQKNPYSQLETVCFHLPVPRLVEKAYQQVASSHSDADSTYLQYQLIYGREVGNCYTASLYLGLLSLLEHSNDLSGKTVGLYSYGSGATCDFFDIRLVPGYQVVLETAYHQSLLRERKAIEMEAYEACYKQYNTGLNDTFELQDLLKEYRGACYLEKIEEHQRYYHYQQKQIDSQQPLERPESQGHHHATA